MPAHTPFRPPRTTIFTLLVSALAAAHCECDTLANEGNDTSAGSESDASAGSTASAASSATDDGTTDGKEATTDGGTLSGGGTTSSGTTSSGTTTTSGTTTGGTSGSTSSTSTSSTTNPSSTTGSVMCGDGACEGSESKSNCCDDCGCSAGFECVNNACIDADKCGNSAIDVGEDCDGSNLGGATCASQGYDGGSLSCTASCSFNTSACCDDECSGADVCQGSSSVQSCGDYDSDSCLELGSTTACTDGQTCSGGECGCAGGEQFKILSAVYPSFGGPGCSDDGTLKLKAAGQMISSTVLRVHVRKEDDTAFGTPSTLTLFVGDGPTCPNPVNQVKNTKAVVVGQVNQTIDLTVNPYGAVWSVGETKDFWVGKDEGGFKAFRATGQVSVKRVCIP